MLDEKILKDANAGKVSYFFCSIYTIAYEKFERSDATLSKNKRMQRQIRKSTNLAKQILIESMIQRKALKS
jgi:hypothetical protein